MKTQFILLSKMKMIKKKFLTKLCKVLKNKMKKLKMMILIKKEEVRKKENRTQKKLKLFNFLFIKIIFLLFYIIFLVYEWNFNCEILIL